MLADFFSSDAVKQQAVVAGFANVEEYLISLVHQDRDRQAIRQGLEELDAGLSRPLSEFEGEFRRRHSIADD